MELEKRKRKDDGEVNVKSSKARQEKDGVKGPVPKDDEVEEFFAMLRRMHVAVQYFQRRNNGGRELTAKSLWSPSFETGDFDGVKKDDPECSQINRHPVLDLNSDPDCISDSY